MANEINNQRLFYMFLSSFENKGGWVSAADQDGDNYIMQCEFYDFIKDNWDGENTPSDNFINKFWNSLDTNTSKSKIEGTNLRNLNALDKKEMEDLEKHLASYVVFDVFFGQNGPVELEKSSLRTSGILTNSNCLNRWKGAVKDALSVFFAQLIAKNPNITEEEINAELTAKFGEVKNAITAEYIGVEYISNLQSTVLKGYDYDLTSDECLASILNNFSNQYLNNMLQDPESYTLQGLKNGIVSLIDQYLEKSGITVSGSNNDNNVNIDDYGFNDNIITSLQKQVVLNTILEKEADLFKTFKDVSNDKHDYLADAKKYLMQLIEDYISEGYSFEELNSVTFEDSDYCEELNDLIEFDKTYDDIEKTTDESSNNDLYTKLATEFGENFADLVAENDQFLEAYTKIISDARNKCMNGELEFGQEAQDYIFNQIKLSIEDFYSDGLSDFDTLDELNTIYDNLVISANAQNNSTSRNEKHQNAAIMYCDALADKSPAFIDVFKEIFGSKDYEEVIKNSSVNQIKEYMNDLKVKAAEIVKILEYNISWENESDIKMHPGSTKSFTPNAIITDATGSVKDVDIDYEVTITGNGKLTREGNRLTIKAPETASNMSILIEAVVNGIVIGRKTINIKCDYEETIDWSNNAKDTKIENSLWYQDGNNFATTLSLSEAYNNNNSLVISQRVEGKGAFQQEAITNLSNTLSIIASAARAAGGYSDAVSVAQQKVLALYSEAINTFADADKKKNSVQSVIDENGDSYKYMVRTWYYTTTAYDDDHTKNASLANGDLGMSINKKYHNTDRYELVINVRCLLDLFNKYYEQALNVQQ